MDTRGHDESCRSEKPFNGYLISGSRIEQADDSHACSRTDRGDFSQTAHENDLSASRKFSNVFSDACLNGKNKRISKLLVLRLALCRERVGVDRELRTRGWLQIQRDTV